jgi:MFS family permease
LATTTDTEKRSLQEDLTDLLCAPRELWIVFFAKFLESLGVFALLYTMTLWLSADHGMSDVDAGSVFGAFNLVVSLITFCIGFFADSWGFRRTLVAGMALGTLSRAVIAFAPTTTVAVIGLMSLTVGYAGGVPVMNTAVRRYTYPSSRAFAFSLYYVTFNVSAAVAGVLVDAARTMFAQPALIELPLLGEVSISAYRAIYLAGLLVSLAGFGFAATLRRGVDIEATDKPVAPGRNMASAFLWFMGFVCILILAQMTSKIIEQPMPLHVLGAVTVAAAVIATSAVGYLRTTRLFKGEVTDVIAKAGNAPTSPAAATNSPIALAMEVISESAFWRFMLVIGLLVFVRLIFSHWHATFPKYAQREFGQSFPIGIVQAINPVLIIVLVPVATALTRHLSAFKVIVVGSIVTALSPFVLLVETSWTAVLVMAVVLSVGECLWSPRLYEYTATVAPRGREASYMGLSALPMFFAKMAVGPLSGYLLETYCPDYGTTLHTVAVAEAPSVVKRVTTPGGPASQVAPPVIAVISPPRINADIEFLVAPGGSVGKRSVRCDRGDGGQPFLSTPSDDAKPVLFSIRADRPGARTVRCVTVLAGDLKTKRPSQTSGETIETVAISAQAGHALGAPHIAGPKQVKANEPVTLQVSAGQPSDGDVRVRCIAPGLKEQATQVFESKRVAGGSDVAVPLKWSTSGEKKVFCTTFDDGGRTSQRPSGTMWLIIGIMTLVGPLLMLGLRGVIEGKRKPADPTPI